MKIFYYILTFCAIIFNNEVVLCNDSAELTELGYKYVTRDSNGFRCEIFAQIIDINNYELLYRLICPSNLTEIKGFYYYIPIEEYHCRYTLFDQTGNVIPKTYKGRIYGRYFDKSIPPYKMLFRYKSFILGLFDRGPTTKRIAGVIANDGSSIESLPKLNEVYKISKPGDYELSVEIRVVVQNWQGKMYKGLKEIKFLPVTIPIKYEKEIEKNNNTNKYLLTILFLLIIFLVIKRIK